MFIPVIQNIQKIFEGFLDLVHLKVIPSVIIPVFAVLFGFENQQIFLALFCLIIFDFITGVIGAHTSGEEIKSKTAVRSAFKVAVYALLVSAGHLTEQITPGFTFIEEAITTFLALTELISILENVGKMGFPIPNKLLNKLRTSLTEETKVTESKVTNEIRDHVANTTEKHTVEEKVTESHSLEKPLG